MPELPEVETVRASLEPALKNAVIVRVVLRRKNLRIPFPEGMEDQLKGLRITSVARRAKYLLFYTDSDTVILAHLGMTGKFSVTDKKNKTATHDHVIFHLKDGRQLIYNDARRFGLITLASKQELSKHKLLAKLGPEPLDKAFSASYLKATLSKRTIPVKVAIMDQAVVVGVGNIYASEALFLAGIHPNTAASKAASKSVDLAKAIRKTLKAAIHSGGSSLKDFVHVSGESGYFQHQFNVYGCGQKPCFTCGSAISTARHGGRSTFFCNNCQK